MNIPDKITMRVTTYADGANGMTLQRYADTDGFGVHKEVRREYRSAPWVEIYWWDYLPGQTFTTFGELRQAAAKVTDDQIAAERAAYPYVRCAMPAGKHLLLNKCRLCDPEGECKPGTLIVHLAHNWQQSEDSHLMLCEDHQHLARDPRALSDALDTDVARRKARAAANGLPW